MQVEYGAFWYVFTRSQCILSDFFLILCQSTPGYCMSRITTMVLRMAWSQHLDNSGLAIASLVFLNAGVLLIVSGLANCFDHGAKDISRVPPVPH